MTPTLLLICVVRDQDALRLADALREKGIAFTKLASTGGFLKEGNTTFLIGIDAEQRETVLAVIRTCCARREEIVESPLPVNEPIGPFVPQKIKVLKGGGVLFEVPVMYYERF